MPFASTRPSVAQFIGGLKPPPVSFATIPYFFIDAFAFVDAAGRKQNVRYSLVPVLPESYLTPDRAKAQSPNYLMDEIASRLQSGEVTFTFIAQIANDGDPTNDATKYWPADRRTVTLGRLSIRAVAPNNRGSQQQILFDPARLTRGIELTDDPLVAVRSQAYAISFARRARGVTSDSSVDAIALGCPCATHAKRGT